MPGKSFHVFLEERIECPNPGNGNFSWKGAFKGLEGPTDAKGSAGWRRRGASNHRLYVTLGHSTQDSSRLGGKGRRSQFGSERPNLRWRSKVLLSVVAASDTFIISRYKSDDKSLICLGVGQLSEL